MDTGHVIGLLVTAIGVIAGCVQVADYLEKKRTTRPRPPVERRVNPSRTADTKHSDVPAPVIAPVPVAVPPTPLALPTGTVAFLFTDMEGSTSLWLDRPDAMSRDLPRHNALLQECVKQHGGSVFKTVGDACHAVFAAPHAALQAALDAQVALRRETWDVGRMRVRMALHVCEVEARGGDYFGGGLSRVSRLRDAGHGGQTLLSEAAQALTVGDLPDGVSLQDRGRHLLPDLQRAEHIYELRAPALAEEFPPLRSLSILPNNLPQQLTSFVGRDVQITEVRQLLSSERLLTLTGAGGSGKTRLALQVAAESAPAYPDGVWLVDLASVVDPSLVAQAVCTVLNVREEAGRALLDVLAEHVQGCRMLLILDSCEHLLPACAALCDRLLRASPHVSVLATSRESLGIAGERSFRVPSLALPELGPLPTPDLLGQYESVRLFVDRARLQGGDFVLSAGNARSVAQVCRGLDGIPFCIELAAARVRVLPVEQIATRLDDCFRLLTGGSRTALPRHQTLRALIDWSYDLLSEPEQVLLCRLSVFSGGWDLEAAEAVGGVGAGDWDVLDLLSALVEKSLVAYELGGDGSANCARYRLLETVRRYAGERLQERGEQNTAHTRHRDYFLTLAETTAPMLVGAEQATGLARLECEHDNLRAALQWCRGEPNGTEAELRLTGALWRFWAIRGYYLEGRERLAHTIARGGGPDAARATATYGAGVLAWQQCEYPVARALLEKSLALRRKLQDDAGVADTLNIQAQIAFEEGDYSSAQALFEESLALHRQAGNRRGEAVVLMNLGNVASEQGRTADARALYDDSLSLHRRMGDRGEIANALINSVNAALDEGSFAAAEAMLREAADLFAALSDKRGIAYTKLRRGDALLRQGLLKQAQTSLCDSLALYRESGDRRGMAMALEQGGRLAEAHSLPISAVRLLGAANTLRREINAPLSAKDTEQIEDTLTALRGAMDDIQFQREWAAGRAMPLEDAVACAGDLHPLGP